MNTIRTTFISCDVLGHIRNKAEMQGTPEYMAESLAEIVTAFVANAEPGDTMALSATYELPADHPLQGVALPY